MLFGMLGDPKVQLWSTMRGRVLMSGEPAVGAMLRREYHWHLRDQTGGDQTRADASGGRAARGRLGDLAGVAAAAEGRA